MKGNRRSGLSFLLLGLVLARPAGASPPRLQRILLLASDSIGLADTSGDARQTLQHLLERYSRGAYLVLNHSVAGDAFSGNPFTGHLPNALEDWASGGIPLVFLGTNDWFQSMPLDAFQAAYTRFAEGVAFNRARIYCITPLWRVSELDRNALGLLVQDYRDAVGKACEAMPAAVLVDGLQLVPADPIYFVDGLHPNARGYAAMARALRSILAQTLPPP